MMTAKNSKLLSATYFSDFVSDSRDFVRLVSEFQLCLCLAFLVQCHLFILPCFVCLDTLVKYFLCVSQSIHSMIHHSQQNYGFHNLYTAVYSKITHTYSLILEI